VIVKPKTGFLILCAALIHISISAAPARTIYVDVSTGNDSHAGNEEAPLKTIVKAADLAEPGDRVIINPGVYHEQIMGGRSGEQDSPIVFEGASDDVIMRGSVSVKDWRRSGSAWVKKLAPVSPENAFVMVDSKLLLKSVDSILKLVEGCFYLGSDGTYQIILPNNANPNSDHDVEAYELDFAFNSGDRWGGTAKKWITIRNLILEKYGVYGISADAEHPAENSHWELDRVTARLNNAEGIFHCLDDWHVHDCKFIRNRGHGCQIDGAGVVFERNFCAENEWFGHFVDAGCGLLIGPDASAHSCVIRNNVFEKNGSPDGYGCGVYLEGRAHDNKIYNNRIQGGTHAGIAFYGSRRNMVYNNVLTDIALKNDEDMAAAFVIGHSFEGEPTEAEGNVIAFNTVVRCAAPVSVFFNPNRGDLPVNRFVNNVFTGCNFISTWRDPASIEFTSNAFFACPLVDPGLLGPKLPQGNALGLDVSDAGFTNMLKKDFSLRPESRLKKAGSPVKGLTTDFAGSSRDAAHPSIGAYE
jgi:parallel beta-helix repeat protein